MTESTRTVERALDILLCFSREKLVPTLTQIAEQVDLHKSTVYRLLATLERLTKLRKKSQPRINLLDRQRRIP